MLTKATTGWTRRDATQISHMSCRHPTTVGITFCTPGCAQAGTGTPIGNTNIHSKILNTVMNGHPSSYMLCLNGCDLLTFKVNEGAPYQTTKLCIERSGKVLLIVGVLLVQITGKRERVLPQLWNKTGHL